MSDQIDPLDKLREYIQQHKQVAKNGDNELVFDHIKVPIDTLTACVNSKKEQYSIGSLWLLAECKGTGHGEYMRKAREIGLKMIPQGEKDDILSYLFGQSEGTDIVVDSLRAQTLIKIGRGGIALKKREEKALSKQEELEKR